MSSSSTPGGRTALALLLGINLFNYIDRFVLAAVEPRIRAHFFDASDPNARGQTGLLATAFLLSYMIAAPFFGRIADRTSRWFLVGICVIVWSIATGASGLVGDLAAPFALLVFTRIFVGIGEAGYGPAAPTIISDYFPVERRGSVLAWFYMAIPVGSALGYVIGGFVEKRWGWPAAFYAVVLPGLVLGVLALLQRDPPRGLSDAVHAPRAASWRDYRVLATTPSYVLDTIGMAALTFAIGGISFWMPDYLVYRGAGSLDQVNLVFGAVTVVAGITATLAGGLAGDMLRGRFPGSYFLVSGFGILISCPLIVAMLFVPFPACWAVIFLAVFFLFFNTGPSNTILANVTHPSIRATAFAVNIFVIHLLGDAISPPLLGRIVGPVSRDGQLILRWNSAMLTVAAVTALAGIVWLAGTRYLQRDTAAAPHQLD